MSLPEAQRNPAAIRSGHCLGKGWGNLGRRRHGEWNGDKDLQDQEWGGTGRIPGLSLAARFQADANRRFAGGSNRDSLVRNHGCGSLLSFGQWPMAGRVGEQSHEPIGSHLPAE